MIAALSRALKSQNVDIRLHTKVQSLLIRDEAACGVVLSDGKMVEADDVIVATGGISYPSTGSTGDGYRMAEESGHALVECTPSLVPFETKEYFEAMAEKDMDRLDKRRLGKRFAGVISSQCDRFHISW